MASNSEAPKCRVRFSLRTLLLLFIPVALVTSLAKWLFSPPPIDVAMTVDRFSWFETVDGRGSPVVALGADVRVVNRSRWTVWYLENTRYYLFQRVDGKWAQRWSGSRLTGAKEDQLWWSAQEGRQSISLLVPVSEDATAIKIGIPFTTDRFNRKAHWRFTPMVKVTKKGQDYFPEVLARNADEDGIESAFAK